MKLIANSQLHISSHDLTVAAGQTFELPDGLAMQLLKAGKVRKADPPRVQYETRVIIPESRTIQPEAPEVSARPPFRDVPVSDPQPPSMAPESHSVLPAANVQGQRVADSGRRGRRNGPRS